MLGQWSQPSFYDSYDCGWTNITRNDSIYIVAWKPMYMISFTESWLQDREYKLWYAKKKMQNVHFLHHL